MGLVLIKAHLSSALIWSFIAGFSTMVDHSGFILPFFSSPYFHYIQLLRFFGNYGVLGWLDYLHGTDVNFVNSSEYEKHSVTCMFLL